MAEVIKGSFNTATYTTDDTKKTRFLTFSWESTGQDVENNKTTISYTLKGAGTYTGWINTRNIKLVVNGTTVYTATGPIKVYNGTVLKSGTATISHNNDGTKNLSASAECGIYYSTINSKGNGSWDLKTIPRASTIKAVNGDIGSETTITIAKASSNYTNTLTWSCSGLNGTIVTKTTATSVKFAIPTSIYEKIPNAKKATVTVICETFNGSTSLGTSTCTFDAIANENTCRPDVSFTSIFDANRISINVTKDNKKFIKDISTARISGIVATPKNSATITSVTAKCGNKTLEALKDGAIIDPLAFVGGIPSGTFLLTATDSRGYSYTLTHEATLYDYFTPTITAKVQRVVQSGNIVKAEYSGKFYNGEISTGMKLELGYLKEGTTSIYDWVEVARVNADGTITTTKGEFTKTNNDFSGSATFDDIEFDYRKEHTLRFRVSDVLQSVLYDCSLTRSVPLFDWGENNFNFNVPLHYEGKALDLPHETTKENGWYVKKYISGWCELSRIEFFSSITTSGTWGTMYTGTINGSSIAYPVEFAEIPSCVVTPAYYTGSNCWIATCDVPGSTVATPKFQVVRPTSATVNLSLSYSVKGYLKGYPKQ